MKLNVAAAWSFFKKLRLVVFAISAVLGSVAWFVTLRRDNSDQLQESVRSQIDFYTFLINGFFSGFGLWEAPLDRADQLWFVIWVFFAFVNFKFLQGAGGRLKNIKIDKYYRYQGYAAEGKKLFLEYVDMPFEKFLNKQGYLNNGTILSIVLASAFGPFLPVFVGIVLIISIVKPSIFTIVALMAVYWYGSALLLELFLFTLMRGVAQLF